MNVMKWNSNVTLFVSRHPGAFEWANRKGMDVDTIEHITQQDLNRLRIGDTVIGTLPTHIAAAVCVRGAKYLHLEMDIPQHLRGLELTADDMEACNAKLQEYKIITVD